MSTIDDLNFLRWKKENGVTDADIQAYWFSTGPQGPQGSGGGGTGPTGPTGPAVDYILDSGYDAAIVSDFKPTGSSVAIGATVYNVYTLIVGATSGNITGSNAYSFFVGSIETVLNSSIIIGTQKGTLKTYDDNMSVDTISQFANGGIVYSEDSGSIIPIGYAAMNVDITLGPGYQYFFFLTIAATETFNTSVNLEMEILVESTVTPIYSRD
jgi:hypothetical protein